MKVALVVLLLAVGSSANLSSMSSLLNYGEFFIDVAKDALVTFAENLAPEDSNDICQDFATFLAKELVKKYSVISKQIKSGKSEDLIKEFMENFMSSYIKRDLNKLTPKTDECKKAIDVYQKAQDRETNTKAAIKAVGAYLNALEKRGDPCAEAINELAKDITSKETLEMPDTVTLLRIVKNIAPKLKGAFNPSEEVDRNLPCFLTVDKIFTNYKSKLTGFLSLAASLGLVQTDSKNKDEL